MSSQTLPETKTKMTSQKLKKFKNQKKREMFTQELSELEKMPCKIPWKLANTFIPKKVVQI